MIFKRLFGRTSAPASSKPSLPIVKFDASRVTEEVRADLWSQILEIADRPDGKEQEIYEAALLSISRGRDLHVLAKKLTELDIERRRAAEIATNLNNRASSLMQVHQQRVLGITEAKWLYSGAPCFINKNPPSTEEQRRDAEHKAANGKRYPVDKGLLIGGKRVYPGREAGCKCVGNAILPGFDT